MEKAVGYLRIRTARKGAGSLGIDAQRADIDAFCRENGYRMIKEFQELEGARCTYRPRLRSALARAKAARALLVIARLEHLSRNLAFTTTLLKSGVDFAACDVPSVKRATLQTNAPIIEEEARAISARMKAALAGAKARGVLVGASNPKCRNLPPDAGHRGGIASRVTRRRLRDSALAAVAGKIKALRAKGYCFRQIALVLNDRGHRTATDRRWGASSVWRAARRIGATGTYRQARRRPEV